MTRYRMVECKNCRSEFPVRGLVKDLKYLECPRCGRLRYSGNFRVIGRFSDEEELANILNRRYGYSPKEIARIVEGKGTLVSIETRKQA